MAPERIVAGPVDHRSDLYAFGALAYELLTGSTPFAGTPQEIVAAQLTNSPEPVSRVRPDTPPALAALVMRLSPKGTCRALAAHRRCARRAREHRANRPAFAPPALRRGRLFYASRGVCGRSAESLSCRSRRVGTPPSTPCDSSLARDRAESRTSRRAGTRASNPAVSPDGRRRLRTRQGRRAGCVSTSDDHRRQHHPADGRGFRGWAAVAAVVTRRLAHRVPGRSSTELPSGVERRDAVSSPCARRRARRTLPGPAHSWRRGSCAVMGTRRRAHRLRRARRALYRAGGRRGGRRV